MIIDRLVVASKNADKIAEVEAVLRVAGVVAEIVRGLEWPDVVEDGATLEANALLKARAVASYTGLAALADDTGLFVDALDGQPGIHAARFAGEQATYADNVALLLERMQDHSDRRAEFRTVVAVAWPDGRPEALAAGALGGQIIPVARGTGGFGYDPVFEVDGRTLAEILPEEKNRVSHRARALHALAEVLRSTG